MIPNLRWSLKILRPLAKVLLIASLAIFLAAPSVSREKLITPNAVFYSSTSKILDERARVLLYISDDLLSKNPVWDSKDLLPFTEINTRIRIDLYTVIAKQLPAAIRSVFPNLTVTNLKPVDRNYDLLLTLDFSSHMRHSLRKSTRHYVNDEPQTYSHPDSLIFNVSFHLFDKNGNDAGEVTCAYDADPLANSDWSGSAQSKFMAEKVLRRFFSDLPFIIASNETILNFLRSREEQWAAAPTLALLAEFGDDFSIWPNKLLDAGETASLTITVANSGPGPALNTKLKLETPNNISIINSTAIFPRIEIGSSVIHKTDIIGDLSLLSDTAIIKAEVQDDRGFGAIPIDIQIPTADLKYPDLEILAVEVTSKDDSTLKSSSLRNGENYKITAQLRNRGVGEARKVSVKAFATQGPVEILSSSSEVASIPPGKLAAISFDFMMPREPNENKASIKVIATDSRGAEVGKAELATTFDVKSAEPLFSVSWKLFDGQRVGTHGNRDSTLSNGEDALLEVVVANDGGLAAEDVMLTLTPIGEGLTIKANTFRIGSIQKNVSSSPISTNIHASHSMDFPGPTGSAEIIAEIRHAGFRPHVQKISLPTQILSPAVEPRIEDIKLYSGRRTDLLVPIVNGGALEALDLVASVTSKGKEVVLLDSRGIPEESHVERYERIEANAGIRHISLALLAKSTGGASTELRLRIEQRGFPPKEWQLPVTLLPHDVQSMQVGSRRSDESAPLPPQVANIPLVSFRNLDEGEVLWRQSNEIELDVFTQQRLSTVVVELNGINQEIAREGREKRPSGDGYRVRFNVNLSEGRNRIVAKVATEDGSTSDAAVNISYSPVGTGTSQQRFTVTDPELRALLSTSAISINGAQMHVQDIPDGVSVSVLGQEGAIKRGLNEFATKVEAAERRLRIFVENQELKRFSEPYHNSHALLVAIDDYDRIGDKLNRGSTGYPSLGKMRSRAEDLRRALELNGFPAENIHTLYDSQATTREFERMLEEFWEGGRYAAADRLLVYFGGHGDTSGGRGYLVGYDFDASRPTASSFLMSDIVYRQFENIATHHVLFIIDACSSGLAVPGATTLSGDPDRAQIESFKSLATIRADTENRARNLLVAGTGDQEALYHSGGIFTAALVEAIKGRADWNDDGIIQLEELYTYVKTEVVASAAERNRNQKPALYSADRLGDGRVVFIRNR